MNCCIKRETEEEAYENAKNIALKPKIPRPPNAFMLYANENRKIMAQQFPADSNKEISKKLGSSWKHLDIVEKNKYFDRARLIDLEHKKKYPNYVYNPKEARIRKAMREATRDRSIGASPMLPRPSARRAASQGWTAAHEEQLMMSPMAAGMRGALDSPVCFPISSGTGSNQFMPPMSAGYSKLESPLPPPTGSVHTNYMQPNPLAQLQQQTEMWHNFQDDMRPRSSGNHYMLQEVPPPFQHQPSPPLSIPSPMMMDKHRQTPHALHPVNGTVLPMTPPLSNISMTPPHSNENVPPDEALHTHQVCKPVGGGEEIFESKHIIDPVQPLMENNMQQNDGFMPVYEQNMVAQPQFEKMEDVKMKKMPGTPHVCPKNPSCKNMLYLPLSCTNFCASPDLFTNNTEYQREYITKYFQNSPDYDVLNFMTESGDSFPYATFSSSLENRHLYEDSPQPNFIQTDVGYIPIMFDNCRSGVNSAKCDHSNSKK